jgi:hypothetical protein
MKNLLTLFVLLCLFINPRITQAENTASFDSLFPVRGLCIAAPSPQRVDDFVKFIASELAPRNVNTLILRVDYAYQYSKHPDLSDENSLSLADVKKLVSICREYKIRLIPQVNLLGHQSWAGTANKLLRVHPEFDETPNVKLPEKYEWPNADGLYCKSYCPLHPDLHPIIFDLIDEICDAFESTAFHAGMDEVFYLGEEQCPRCSGRDKAELFAGEVRTIHDHLLIKKRELWIWGDRLIDGKTTGLGMWEASYNTTCRAVDLIPKDVFICDWHYERPDLTSVYFAMKGLRVATCPYRNAVVGIQQVKDMARFRKEATPEMREQYCGMIQTVWSDAESFMDGFNKKKKNVREGKDQSDECLIQVFSQIEKEVKQ